MIKILKLDHRPERDKRITTHCALVARAFCAEEFYYSGIEDYRIEENIKNIKEKWGGDFKIEYVEKPSAFIKKVKEEKKTIIIHLTMYGEQIIKIINNVSSKINIEKLDLLVVVGGPKVPKLYYELADYNVSVTNQPQSEVGALAVILYLLNPDALNEKDFKNNKIKLIPNNTYKDVINLK